MLEERRLLSGSGWPPYLATRELKALLHRPWGNPAVRPNTPVSPFGTASKSAAFIDPSARIVNGYAVITSPPGFIGPYATLDAHGGAIKIGTGSVILDNAAIVGNAVRGGTGPVPVVLIGNSVLIEYGAKVLGPGAIGAYDATAAPVRIGPGALIDRARIEPGAIVSALARVGPGVTLPSGFRVLPGKNVTTDAEASDPSLGKVEPVTAAEEAAVRELIARNLSLAAGYNQLYQGRSATGVSPGVDPAVSGIYNGNLAIVSGVGPEPGSPTASTAYLPPGASPQFLTPARGPVKASLWQFRARITGAAVFQQKARDVAHSLGNANAIRADIGQPFTIASIRRTGSRVTINSPLGGALTIGQNLVAGKGTTILGGSRTTAVLGDNVTIGRGAVVSGSSLGAGSVVGDRAIVLNSTFDNGASIPAGSIYINNQRVGNVEW